ncbi:hypothetical protein RBB79_17020 [Tunturiibacter empetritectus]|uniref:Uncharacterized protein n=2 Tax=Tunturiibacter TaxID=3154218 RepID=A0A852VI00_9BACT|nr:hypothetical protein [Edaphobacter lichenicola]NYF91327.1 hypothetical protein [Edaphobacter lichenicola]
MLRFVQSWMVVLFGTVLATSYGQSSIKARPTDFPSFTVFPGAADSDGLPTSGAKLCLLKPAGVCFQMPSHRASDSVEYEFGLDPRSEILSLPGGGSLVFFSSQFSGGGSGTLDRLAILRYQVDGKIINLMPFVGVTNQSDRAVWHIASISNFPILMTADFYWRDGETHFSEHYYTVTAYEFDTKRGRYVKAFSYETSKRYPGLDRVDQVHVLNSERAQILRRLETGLDEHKAR